MQNTFADFPQSFIVRRWLYVVAAAIFIMALIGAITRLTESGLSIVEWGPLLHTLPPLNDDEWQRVFGLYQQYPEYRFRNMGMDISAFKKIYFWEWLHRFWGQMIGYLFAFPMLFFFVKYKLPRTLRLRLVLLLLLGGLQGAIGWIMVLSGLDLRPSVSHIKLALHLLLALLLYGAVLWTAWQLAPQPTRHTAKRHSYVTLFLLVITIIYGAFVAGLDAGFVYNTFPLMNGQFAPPELWVLSPLYLNFLDNTAMVQFTHRWLALVTAGVALFLAFRMPTKSLRLELAAAVVLQVALGISTLLMAVPVALGALHQAGAIVLLTVVLRCVYRA